ncbi:MAG: GNAT family N-acetyltransferase [Acidobacteria bacterium]|nr:GNAT family N-acetyltransferase [Acidobacteriota bacterium]
MNVTGENWLPKTQGLRFSLGEFCLYQWQFPALVLDLHYSEIPKRFETQLPIDHLTSSTEALFVPSCASIAEYPTISFDKTFIRYIPERYEHYGIEYNGTFEDYLAGLRSKARHELLRKLKKFDSHFKTKKTFREFRLPEEVNDFYSFALVVSKKTYQHRLLHAGLPEDDDHKRESIKLAGLDQFRGYLLLDETQPIAYGYCRAQASSLLYLHTGYDPQYRQWSPGMVLLYHIVDMFYSEGKYRVLDFGSGNASWKKDYSTTSAICARAYYFRKTNHNAALLVAHRITTALSDLVVKVIDAIGLKQKLKRYFRSSFGMSQTPDN